MQPYTRMATPRFRRITLRISGLEIEFRTRIPIVQERPSREERALRRARVEEQMSRARQNMLSRRALGL